MFRAIFNAKSHDFFKMPQPPTDLPTLQYTNLGPTITRSLRPARWHQVGTAFRKWTLNCRKRRYHGLRSKNIVVLKT